MPLFEFWNSLWKTALSCFTPSSVPTSGLRWFHHLFLAYALTVGVTIKCHWGDTVNVVYMMLTSYSGWTISDLPYILSAALCVPIGIFWKFGIVPIWGLLSSFPCMVFRDFGPFWDAVWVQSWCNTLTDFITVALHELRFLMDSSYVGQTFNVRETLIYEGAGADSADLSYPSTRSEKTPDTGLSPVPLDMVQFDPHRAEFDQYFSSPISDTTAKQEDFVEDPWILVEPEGGTRQSFGQRFDDVVVRHPIFFSSVASVCLVTLVKAVISISTNSLSSVIA